MDQEAGAVPGPLAALVEDPRRSALFLDFDGTLSPIVDDPRDARPLPGVPGLLARLAARLGLVAVVSGRPVSFLQSVLQSPTGVRLVGLYGLEQIDEGGQRRVTAGAAGWEAVIAAVVARAGAEAPAGVYVEPKGLTVTLHWRHAPGEERWVTSFAARHVEEDGLAVHPGRFEVELRPPLPVDKGTVVDGLAGGFTAVAFFGDDLGDLPAFDALNGLAARGVAVACVAAVDGESPAIVAQRADVVVEGAPGALALLELMARRVGAPG